MMLILAVAALLFFAASSFFFALAESALFSLGRWQIRQVRENSPRVGQVVSELLMQPQDLLGTIVLGNTFANAVMVGSVLWMAVHSGWPMWVTIIGLLLVILLGAEVLPKTLAVRSPEFWALQVARPMKLLVGLTVPLRKIAQRFNETLLRVAVPKSVKPQTAISEEEYQELLELAYQQGTLAQAEKEIILQIIGLDRRTVKDAMKPLSQMACISDDLPVEEMIAAAQQLKHTRLPMYDETPDTIVGVLNTRLLLLQPDVDLAEVIEFPSFVPETMNLLHLLKSLQRQQRGMAIVLDEFGGTAGIITMEDILEEIVGEIRDEAEATGFVIEKLGEGRWRVSGTMRIDDFRREYPALGDVAEVDTMAGLVLSQSEMVPAAGESVTFRGLKLTVHVADERRIRELLVEVLKRK